MAAETFGLSFWQFVGVTAGAQFVWSMAYLIWDGLAEQRHREKVRRTARMPVDDRTY